MTLRPEHALQAAWRPAPTQASKARVLIAGATGATGEAVLVALAASPRVSRVDVLLQRPVTVALRHVHGLLVEPDCPHPWPRVKADEGVILFDPPRSFHGREKALLPVRPEQLPAVARWMHGCGVRRLLVVLPHAQGRLPDALKRGLANLDEQAVAALGFEAVVFVRSAQAPSSARHRQALQRLAHAMLGVLHHLVPARQKPVSARRVAQFALNALERVPPGLHVAAPERVWAAAQGDPAAVVSQWLGERGPARDNAV